MEIVYIIFTDGGKKKFTKAGLKESLEMGMDD